MDDGDKHLGGGRPRMMTDSSTDHTGTSSSWGYISLVKEEDDMAPNGYPFCVVKPIVDKGVDGT